MPPPSWPAAASTQAAAIAGDWLVFTVGALLVAALVWALILYPAFRFRARRGRERATSQRRNNAPLEIGWTVAPLLIVIGLFVYTYRVEARVEALGPAALRVDVDAFRWGWRFAYAGGPTIRGTAQNPPQLVLPQGETVEIRLTSSDVVHAFWVPAFLFQRDATPGLVTRFDLTPDKLGTFEGKCAEFCGLDHALMTFSVRVVPPDAFRTWLRGPHP